MKRKLIRRSVRSVVKQTQNNADHFKTVSKLSVAEVIRAVDYINLLAAS